MTDQQHLEQLLRSGHACVSILTFEEKDALQLVTGAIVETGGELLKWSVTLGLHDGLIAGGATVANTDHPAAALFFLSGLTRSVNVVMLDLIPHLKDDRTMRSFRECVASFADKGSHLILIDDATDLPPAVQSVATPLELSLPDEKALEKIVVDQIHSCGRIAPVQIVLNQSELRAVIGNLRGLNTRQVRQIIRDVCDDRRLDKNDLPEILSEKRQLMSGAGLLEFVQAPVSLDEIGGVRRLKFWLEQRKESLCNEAEKFGIPPPRGVLLLGVQGAGKSLSAKAVATAWQRPLLRMDVGALYDKYIGESERRLRDAFHQAEMMSPIILWIDEIEKAFASAASQSSDGGLSKRMFGALLTWMQERTAPVFIVATANDIEALPPELLRKGRFDEIFFVDLPDADGRRMILQIHLLKRKRDPKKFDMDRLVKASDGFSGAEIEQAIIAALNEAFSSRGDLTTDMIVKAFAESPPLSVTMKESVDALRAWSKGRCMPAD